jgi:predicted enzyme related to lactoylglutathione lyase
MSNNAEPRYGNGKICYLELPSRDIEESSSFYHDIFQWNIRKRSNGAISFDDSVGEVSGTWRMDRKPATEIGTLVHIMVDDIEVTIQKIKDHGGIITQPVGMDLPEITAQFRDPSGNLFGLFQQDSR